MIRRNVEGGFIVEQEHLPGRCYVLTGPWTDLSVKVFHAEGAQFLRLNRVLGARVEDLQFLKELRGLRGVEIYDPTITMRALAPLLELHTLELLGLQCKFKDIDFAACFPRLQFASFHWQRGCETVFRCRELQFLFIDGYPGADLSEFAALTALKRLHVSSKSLVSAQGAPELANLAHLTFTYCPSLIDVNAVSRCRSLRVLELYDCKEVAQLPTFSSCSLQRLTIENGGSIESLTPLLACEHLEEVYLAGTEISDGDASPLLVLARLRKVAFPRSKLYSHTMDEVNAILAARR